MCVSAALVRGVREQSGLPVISVDRILWRFLHATGLFRRSL